MTMLVDDPRGHDAGAAADTCAASLAPLSPLQARRFRDKFGVIVLNCYGQTEIGGEIVGWNAADSRELRGDQARRRRPAARGRDLAHHRPDGADYCRCRG